MKTEKRNRFQKALIVISVVLLIACLFLIYKGGYVQRLLSHPKTTEVNNSQYIMRESLFNVLPKSKTDIAFVGDSLTEKCEWREMMPDYKVVNRGIGNDTTKGVLDRINEIVALSPKKIFLMVGINDLGQKVDINTILKNYDGILSAIKNALPDSDVYIESVLPTTESQTGIKSRNIVELNTELSKLASKYKYSYVDIYSDLLGDGSQIKPQYTADGVHLTGSAYQIWFDKIKPFLG